MSESQKAAAEAVKGLLSLADGFPFASERDKSAWLAGLLTVAFRRQIRGPVPMFWIFGDRATGKTLLANHTARLCQRKPLCRVSADFNYRMMVAAVRAQNPMVLIDNVGKPLKEEVLCSMITSSETFVRHLGMDRCVSHPQNTVFWATGLNVYAFDELMCRLIPIELAAKARPSEYEGIASLERADRSKLKPLASTLFDNYEHKPERASRGLEPWERDDGFTRRFAQWTWRIREPLIFAGLPDPVPTLPELHRIGFAVIDPREAAKILQPSAEQ